MSKFGWDLPPGVRTSDIPGNRPEDYAMEEDWNNLMDDLETHRVEPEKVRDALLMRHPEKTADYQEAMKRRRENHERMREWATAQNDWSLQRNLGPYILEMDDALEIDLSPSEIRRTLTYANVVPRELAYKWLCEETEKKIRDLQDRISEQQQYLDWLKERNQTGEDF